MLAIYVCVMIQFYRSDSHITPMVNFRNLPVATVSLIALNLLVFAFGFFTDSHTWIIRNFGFVPDSVFVRNELDNSHHSSTLPTNPTSPENGTASTLVRLLSSMFIHASITHIVFNLAALGYIGGYSERSIGTGRYVVILFSIWYMWHFIPWGNSLICFGQRSDVVDRGIRSYFWGIRYCSSYWKSKSLLLAPNSNSFCVRRFSNLDTHCIHCAYWRLFGRSNTYETYGERGIAPEKRNK